MQPLRSCQFPRLTGLPRRKSSSTRASRRTQKRLNSTFVPQSNPLAQLLVEMPHAVACRVSAQVVPCPRTGSRRLDFTGNAVKDCGAKNRVADGRASASPQLFADDQVVGESTGNGTVFDESANSSDIPCVRGWLYSDSLVRVLTRTLAIVIP